MVLTMQDDASYSGAISLAELRNIINGYL